MIMAAVSTTSPKVVLETSSLPTCSKLASAAPKSIHRRKGGNIGDVLAALDRTGFCRTQSQAFAPTSPPCSSSCVLPATPLPGHISSPPCAPKKPLPVLLGRDDSESALPYRLGPGLLPLLFDRLSTRGCGLVLAGGQLTGHRPRSRSCS